MLDKLLDMYSQSFNITKNYIIGDTLYDAYGYGNITNAKYVLIKKAELWRALCFEHAFFKQSAEITPADITDFLKNTIEHIEPVLVRNGEKCTVKDHMYSYITGIFICENGISKETASIIKKVKFHKDYMLSIRGYCDMRLLVIDLKNKKVYGNPAAKDLVKDYCEFLPNSHN